jgi:hypothetical protein
MHIRLPFQLFFLLLLGLLLPEPCQAQLQLSWDDLYQVTFEERADGTQQPLFDLSLRRFDGEEVYISGYVIPLDLRNNLYVISAYPNASCFFCGGAGPESVMELQLGKARRNYRTDEWKRFKGRLCLNESQDGRLHYVLENAEEF